jgi:dipicolinate synthase subunit B
VNEIRVGFAVCGSFCTHSQALDALEELTGTYDTIIPIISDFAVKTDTRFGKAEDFVAEMVKLCGGRNVISTIQAAEPIGPQKLLDILVIAPCTGNTLAKLTAGLADSAVTMAAKAHLRNGRPIVVAVSTNDGLSTAARNIGELLCRKNYYFVPFRQDDPKGKPTSLVADMKLVASTVAEALEGRQIQPILLGAGQD